MPVRNDNPDENPTAAPKFGPSTKANPLWRVVILTGVAFTVSCLAWTASGFGNPEAPGNQWLGRNGLLLVAGTGTAAIVTAVAAMAVDSVQTTRMSAEAQSVDQEPDSENGERRS